MATIRPFRAIRPSTKVLHPLDFAGEETGSGLELDYVKYRLEPCALGGMPGNSECRDFFGQLLDNESYIREEHPAIYIYERITGGVSITGIWAVTSLADLEKGNIARHELTLAEKEEKLSRYRTEVELEGAPIVLAYRENEALKLLINRVKGSAKGFAYSYQDTYHKFWRVNAISEVMELKIAFEKIGQVYLADGHHRLGSAAALHRKSPQWISSLYYPSSEIKIDSFHRLIRRTGEECEPDLLGVLGRNFYMSVIPNNKPLFSEVKGRLGLCMGGAWYQLDKKECDGNGLSDAAFLQDNVLEPAFGITDARTDNRLECYAAPDFKKFLLEIEKDLQAVAFTLCPMEVDELLLLSAAGVILPPKSTYITPKAPFGLLMYHSGVLKEKGAKA